MEQKSVKHPILKGVLLGISAALLATSLGLLLLLNSDALYKADLKKYELAKRSGYSEEMILRNYRAVTDYLLPWNSYEFDMPDMPYSEGGAIHFADTKRLMNGFFIAGAAALCYTALVLLLERRKNGFKKTLFTAGLSAVLFPTALAACAAVDFDTFFVAFHKLFFNNDYWIFDWRTDPIILVLPEAYFMHCALFIAAFWLIGAFLLFWDAKGRGNRKNT